MKHFDLICLGGGPGGYTAAIRANQLGLSVAVIEKNKLGGVCLHSGCIPTKALLKSAQAIHQISNMKALGITVKLIDINMAEAIKRSRAISERFHKGLLFLMKSKNIEIIHGRGVLKTPEIVEVENTEGHREMFSSKNIVLATGCSQKILKGLEYDGIRIIGPSDALNLEQLPKKIAIIGGGAIGCEFAYLWNSFGVDVHIFELQAHLLPLEDEDSSFALEKAYKKYGITLHLGLKNVSAKNTGESLVITMIKEDEETVLNFDKCLLAVGMKGTADQFDSINIAKENGFISVNSYYQTSIANVYAIGDIAGPPLLAHAAAHEGVIAVEHLMGHDPKPLDRLNIPNCTYSYPQVASVGQTEQELKDLGIEYTVGHLPFIANAKAVLSFQKEGHVKTLFSLHGELLGAHIVGEQATELIHEYVLLKTMEGIDEDLFSVVHAHPTLSELLVESALHAKGRSFQTI